MEVQSPVAFPENAGLKSGQTKVRVKWVGYQASGDCLEWDVRLIAETKVGLLLFDWEERQLPSRAQTVYVPSCYSPGKRAYHRAGINGRVCQFFGANLAFEHALHATFCRKMTFLALNFIYTSFVHRVSV